MSQEACRTTFAAIEAEDPDASRALRLDRQQPNCCCQVHSVSQYSSGCVGDEEILVRILISPQHMHKKRREPAAAAISAAELSGLSVFRDAQATDEQIRKVAEGLIAGAKAANNPKVGVFGVLKFLCHKPRRLIIVGETEECYGVYDTALPDNPSHSEIFQRIDGIADELRLARRTGLFSIIKADFVPVSDYRNGFLLDLAPTV